MCLDLHVVLVLLSSLFFPYAVPAVAMAVVSVEMEREFLCGNLHEYTVPLLCSKKR